MRAALRRFLCALIGHAAWSRNDPLDEQCYVRTGRARDGRTLHEMLLDSKCERCGIRYGDYYR